MSDKRLNINLDDILLDVATVIEPSDADRRIMDRRFRRLKEHLERSGSSLALFMQDDQSRIYAQGSVSISATIISGDEDDRFDVDAIVEFDVPSAWPNEKPLDLLFEALQGFPGAERIVRNTRCVTIEFAFMHMDVTPMDPKAEPRPERVGEIFHSPDHGEAYRVPSNSYGFARWVRRTVVLQQGIGSFAEQVVARRTLNSVDRLQPTSPRAADQDDLPPMIPPRLDAQQIVALKLMKRFLNIAYRSRSVRRPPSIYFTKLAVDCGFDSNGLTSQLRRLATYVQNEMATAMAVNCGPDERNPVYPEDRINDRWPRTLEDRRVLHAVMGELLAILDKAHRATFAEIASLLSGAFGEVISGRAVKAHLERREKADSPSYVKGAGTIIPATTLGAPAIVRDTKRVPDHHFHCEDFSGARQGSRKK